jgi:two-component system chemotaxis sensor kinase CheA
MNDEELDEVVNEFITESHENLDQLDQELVHLEQRPDPEVIARIFHTIHTIKGTSGFLGFTTLEAVTHVGENLLSKLRDGVLQITTDITSALLSMVDAVREILASVAATGAEGGVAYDALVARLTQLSDGGAPAAPEPVQAVEAVEVVGAPAEAGEIAVEASDNRSSADERAAADERAVGADTIRVDVSLLDDLMNLVGELVLARNQILQFVHSQGDPTFIATSQRLNLITTELQAGVMKTRMQPIENVWNKFPRVVRDLTVTCGKRARLEMDGKHTELDKTLLEAIKDPLTHLVRNAIDHGLESPAERIAHGKLAEGVVRLRAFHEGGQVIIEISDDGAGIDAGLLRAKAVQKGLLSADEAATRSDRDMLDVIFQPGFSTAETVSNLSGRGVGMDVVRTNIESIGGSVEVNTVVGSGTTFRVKIPLTLAIIPALVVSIGVDRYAIPQVSLLELLRIGRTGIEWIQGVPIYRLRGHLLPLVFLDRVFNGAASDEDRDIEASESYNIVVVQADDVQFGLVVDEISDTAEIVVKPLGRLLKHVEAFAGATIMGDGRVALILDVMGIANHVGITSRARAARSAAPVETDDVAGERARLLIFSLGDRRLGLPLEAVARLEEFQLSDIETTGHRQVVQYRGEIMHLVDLGKELGLPSTPAADQSMHVVVYSEGGASVGLIVDQIFDIVEERFELVAQGAEHGISGAAVIQGLVTDVVDVPAILRRAIPSLFRAQGVAA